MELELIKDNAEKAERDANQSTALANARTFEFSDLQIKIAFAAIGLAATRIVTDKQSLNLVNSKIGIIILILSIIAGAIQMVIDRQFFKKNKVLFNNVAISHKKYRSSPEDAVARDEASDSIEKLNTSLEHSIELPLYIQTGLVLLGATFILLDVFFTPASLNKKLDNGFYAPQAPQSVHHFYHYR